MAGHRLHESWPRLRFELSVEMSRAMAEALRTDMLDVAILMSDTLPPGAIAHPLPPVRLGWYAAPGLIPPNRALDAAALAALPIITFPRGARPYHDVAERLISREGSTPVIHCSASLSMTYHLTARGFGVGTIPNPLVQVLDPMRGAVHRLSVAPELDLPEPARPPERLCRCTG